MVGNEVVSVSIFYNQSMWHRLLRDMLGPYLKSDDLIACPYSLFFSQERGDHVTVLIQSPKSRQTECDFFEKISNYLAKCPANEKEIQLPISAFFMDYPTNACLSDFENFTEISFVKKNDSRIRKLISSAMLDALQSDEIDLQSIYSFLIYMLLGTIKAAFPHWNEVLFSIPDLFSCLDQLDKDTANHINGSLAKEDQMEVRSFFSNNCQVVFEIVEMLWLKKIGNVDLVWLNVWVKNIKSSIEIENPTLATIDICLMIYEHLGITDYYFKSRFTFYLFKFLGTGVKI